MKSSISCVLVIAAISACQNFGRDSLKPAGNNSGGQNPANPEISSLSYNLFTENVELFVEFRPFVKGYETSFAAHLNDVEFFKPFDRGSLKVILENEVNHFENTADSPTVPGIFRPVLTPDKEGVYSLTFQFLSEEITETLTIDSINVFNSAEEAMNMASDTPEEGVITFLKEQTWKTSFATMEMRPRVYYTVINSSAKIKAQPQSQVLLNAQSAGQVSLFRVIGEKVSKGALLAVISGAGIDNHLSVRINEIRIAYEKSKADYDRTLPLAETKVLSQRDFLEIRSRYLQDSVRYYQLAKNISQDGLRIVSPIQGIISQINVKNGEYLEAGSPVIQITSDTDLLIETYVNQSDYYLVPGIFDAHFRVPSSDKTFALTQLQGKKIAGNAFVTGLITRIPVSFSISNKGELMPGMFLEAFLLTNKTNSALVIPLTAIIEEQGQYFVYVQTNGESFVKRQVSIANIDGMNSEVTAGLHAGERVVVKGAYQIKLSSMSGALPLHGHTH
ncbi:MAG TPA: efflux RND transporter periplasmic adaptor subunit [Cyclobacteriaceae bacterium]|nr:efflux RND transporter periplasmic adaptor subunit [Cyclobacteriaceae bacterium]